MARTKFEIEIPPEAIAQDLLWHYETCKNSSSKNERKLAKSLKRVVMYYMTYSQIRDYFGDEEAERWINED